MRLRHATFKHHHMHSETRTSKRLRHSCHARLSCSHASFMLCTLRTSLHTRAPHASPMRSGQRCRPTTSDHVDTLNHCGHLCNGRWQMADVRTVFKGWRNGDVWHSHRVCPSSDSRCGHSRRVPRARTQCACCKRVLLKRAAHTCLRGQGYARRSWVGGRVFAALCASGRSESANKATTCDLMA